MTRYVCALLRPGAVHEEATSVCGVRVQASSQPPLQAFLEAPRVALLSRVCVLVFLT